MLKAGLITGLLAILVAAIATYFSPLCAPCAVIFLGAFAGYLAGVFDKPSTNNAATKAGALGGVIGGVGAIIGQIIGTAINGIFLGPQGAAEFGRNLGLPGSGGPGYEGGYWAGLVGGAVCFSILDILIMAGFGALGGMLWWQISGKNKEPSSVPSAMPPIS